MRQVDCHSFFNFFNDVTLPDMQELEHMDEISEKALCSSMEHDFDLACEFRDEIVPNAVYHYLKSYKGSMQEDSEEEFKKPVKLETSASERSECKVQ